MKDLGLLQPLGVPNLKPKSISMAFIVKLLKTQSKFDSIMVVVDRLTKIAHFKPTITIDTAYGVVKLFLRKKFKHHKVLREIISNRDRKFVSEFWSALFKVCGTKIKLSTAYHLETDEQNEQTNKTLKNILRMYPGKRQQSWDKW